MAYTINRTDGTVVTTITDGTVDNTTSLQLFGKSFCDVYGAVKRHEAEAFMKFISPWEREHLLLNV